MLVLFSGVVITGSVGAGAGGVYICAVGVSSGVGVDSDAGVSMVNVAEFVTVGGGAGDSVVMGVTAEVVVIVEVLNYFYFLVYMKWVLIFWVNYMSTVFMFSGILIFKLLGFELVFFFICVNFWGFSDFDFFNCFLKFCSFREGFITAAVVGWVDGFDSLVNYWWKSFCLLSFIFMIIFFLIIMFGFSGVMVFFCNFGFTDRGGNLFVSFFFRKNFLRK